MIFIGFRKFKAVSQITFSTVVSKLLKKKVLTAITYSTIASG